jgi:hypothetical protein
MTTTTNRLAKPFAANILECELRNDFGGLHGQAMRDFTEATFVWGPVSKLYTLPNGRKVKDIRRAIKEWANS